jgi:hypothetical protein
MGLKRGHRFPARFIGDALHLVSFDPGGSDDPAISLNGLRETLRGDVILFEQSMLFLAVHGTISMGQPSAAKVVSYHKCEIRHARPGSARGVQDTNMTQSLHRNDDVVSRRTGCANRGANRRPDPFGE